MMKGLFLFQHESSGSPEVDYRFRTSEYGPVTDEIYRDLKTLEKVGFVSRVRVPAASYRITAAGRRQLSAVSFDPGCEARLVGLRTELSRLSFPALIGRVSTLHPEFAEQEDRLFRGLRERYLARNRG